MVRGSTSRGHGHDLPHYTVETPVAPIPPEERARSLRRACITDPDGTGGPAAADELSCNMPWQKRKSENQPPAKKPNFAYSSLALKPQEQAEGCFECGALNHWRRNCPRLAGNMQHGNDMKGVPRQIARPRPNIGGPKLNGNNREQTGRSSETIEESLAESTQSSCHVMNFSGSIIYCRTMHEVEQATIQLLDKIKTMKAGTTPVSLGFDVEWRPNFIKGESRNKVAVMQLCVDDSNCYVLHFFHSGIPPTLKYLLSDTETIKVGIGIVSDAEKVMEDYNVRVEPLEDLSALANLQFGCASRNWGLASLVEKLTSKKLPKSKRAKMGNWERKFLESGQLQYAATDAFASLKIHEALMKNYPVVMSEDICLANAIGGVRPA